MAHPETRVSESAGSICTTRERGKPGVSLAWVFGGQLFRLFNSLQGNLYRLSHPPSGVRRKSVLPDVVVFPDGPHQANIALLNQIKKSESPIDEMRRGPNSDPQVCLNEALLGLFSVLGVELSSVASEPS